ncbi:MAG: DUF1080 domain-containing protein, partial [Ginsengibacter sp.]
DKAELFNIITIAADVNYAGSYLQSKDTIPGNNKRASSKEWEILFDGKNTNKWRSPDSDTFPGSTWSEEGASLFVAGHARGQDLITRDKYFNFELVFDFNLTYGANSGVKYFVEKIKNNKTGQVVWNGPEYQIIDDFNNPDLKNENDPKATTAALYLIYAPENKKLLPAGQWNHARIVVNGNHVEHWLNGIKVVSYERGTKDFRNRMAATKFKDYDHYGESAGGHIMLTDHDGDQVYFRDIRIKKLN